MFCAGGQEDIFSRTHGKIGVVHCDKKRPLCHKNKHITVKRSPDVQKTAIILKTAAGEKPRLWAFFVYIEHFLTPFYLIISHLLHFVTRAKIKALQNAELLNMLL